METALTHAQQEIYLYLKESFPQENFWSSDEDLKYSLQLLFKHFPHISQNLVLTDEFLQVLHEKSRANTELCSLFGMLLKCAVTLGEGHQPKTAPRGSSVRTPAAQDGADRMAEAVRCPLPPSAPHAPSDGRGHLSCSTRHSGSGGSRSPSDGAAAAPSRAAALPLPESPQSPRRRRPAEPERASPCSLASAPSSRGRAGGTGGPGTPRSWKSRTAPSGDGSELQSWRSRRPLPTATAPGAPHGPGAPLPRGKTAPPRDGSGLQSWRGKRRPPLWRPPTLPERDPQEGPPSGATQRRERDKLHAAAHQHRVQQHQDKPPGKSKKVLARNVLGTVKWFNVKNKYGFITRNDNQEDVFVHQTAIKKNNPRKYLHSLGDGEIVEFNIIQGRKGPQAADVTGPGGVAVQGSKHAPDYKPTKYRSSPHTYQGNQQPSSPSNSLKARRAQNMGELSCIRKPMSIMKEPSSLISPSSSNTLPQFLWPSWPHPIFPLSFPLSYYPLFMIPPTTNPFPQSSSIIPEGA